jgi:hypothetical protein
MINVLRILISMAVLIIISAERFLLYNCKAVELNFSLTK